jgi:hypothetical protein
VKARIYVDSDVGVAQIQNFRPIADAEKRSETHTGLTVGAGGSLFVFDAEYRDVPVVKCFLQGGGNLVAAPSSVTTSGFIMDVYNPSTGASVGVADVAGYTVEGV